MESLNYRHTHTQEFVHPLGLVLYQRLVLLQTSQPFNLAIRFGVRNEILKKVNKERKIRRLGLVKP